MSDLTYLTTELADIPDRGLYRVTQFLFDKIHNLIPEKLQNLPIEVGVYGFGGAYLLTRGLQLLSKKVIDKIIPGFDEKALPILEKACIYGLPAAVVLYALIDQEGAKEWIYSKPMDNWGIMLAYLGGVTGALQDLNKRSKKKLEDSLK